MVKWENPMAVLNSFFEECFGCLIFVSPVDVFGSEVEVQFAIIVPLINIII